MCAAEVDQHVAQRFLLRQRLGQGAYGIVWKAVDRRTGEVVAIKKIFDAFKDKTDAQRTFWEVTLLQKFGDHPNIIRLLDIIRAENDRDLYLVFESMDTDLNAVLRKGKLLKDIHKRYIFYQLLQATKFIHSGNVVHRDQKPANVLLDANCRVKLCDFGLARSLSQCPEGSEGHALTEYVATRWYRAPEVLLSSRWYTCGVDMWSLGCILGEMLRGTPLFPGSSSLHQLQLILEHVPLPPEEDILALGSGYSASVLQRLGGQPQQMLDSLLPQDTPPEALDLLRRLLVFTPDQRLSAAEALQHPYVRRFYCPTHEWTLEADTRLPLPESVQLSAAEYRSRLYQMILERKGHRQVQGSEGSGATPPVAWPWASQPHPQEPGAVLQPSLGAPVQKATAWPADNPLHGPCPRRPHSVATAPFRAQPGSSYYPPEDLGMAHNAPRRSSSKAVPKPLLGPSWVNPHVTWAAPSLTAQAAADVVNKVLIRREARGREVATSGTRPSLTTQASRGPRCSPAVPLPQDPGLEPRPGRRMFSTSALQGAQGAARAALGGFTQAYGTVCHSALCRLPLPPRPGPHA
ncbi:PREDICTED: mitogen-activated protein kinase 15 [Elephantulus edwardii]|uniref:mitogen-activated protein kinase 15 n=1 Tax=Elephantulus edwardii TaxID=28737 RepID=UPI0003F09509|nr:PREDICTED: mitogen-activated protein kinase 15 [Elephantulus edwardii]